MVKKFLVAAILILGSAYLHVEHAHQDRHIYLGTSIGFPEEYLSMHEKWYGYQGKVYIHLVGNGGHYEGAEYLSNLWDTMPNVELLIDGNTYSAHAMLALTKHKKRFPNKGFMMLHLVSGTNMIEEYCKATKGKDRGLDAHKKCIANGNTKVGIWNDEILEGVKPYITKEQIKALKEGREIYIPYKELKNVN